MKIQWLGHSAFLLEESTGTRVITDPYGSHVGFEMPAVQADIVTVSHQHKDHNNTAAVLGNPQVLHTIGGFEIKGVHIFSLNSHHDKVKGQERGNNIIFVFGIDGVDICHLGDIGEACTLELAEAIGAVNVLIIPVGGEFTIDAEEAKEYVDKLMPDVVIPMHFKSHDSEFDIEKVDAFLKYFDDEDIIRVEGDTIELDRNKFDNESTKVVLFDSHAQ